MNAYRRTAPVPKGKTRRPQDRPCWSEVRVKSYEGVIRDHFTTRDAYVTYSQEGWVFREQKSLAWQVSWWCDYFGFTMTNYNKLMSLVSKIRLVHFNFLAIIFLFIVWIQRLICFLIPTSYFFVYHSVIPAKETFAIWEPLRFISTYETKKDVQFHWNDILMCDSDWDVYWFWRIAAVTDKWIKKKQTLTTTPPRLYLEPWPSIPSTCYLVSEITVHTPIYNIEKTQVVVWPEFRVE